MASDLLVSQQYYVSCKRKDNVMDNKLKAFVFKFLCKDGKTKMVRLYANHIGGAVRRLYQQYDVEDLKAVIPE